ncbi:MAG TPA: hypothetical protein VFD56_06315 [Chitinophagaceae bacterium]|nr:hypothetical protein [Chitinophagaceae bacterium]
MDSLDNMIFATLESPFQSGSKILSDYIPPAFGGFQPGIVSTNTFNPVYGFSQANKEAYASYPDYSIFEDAILRHWYDINGNGVAGSLADNFQYEWIINNVNTVIADFTKTSSYHLIYAYLIENTRILQIFERLIEKYSNEEDFGIAPPSVYQWILNSERLFFKSETSKSRNVRSLLRPSFESNRRNAYYRMFGMDLAFGDINSGPGGTVSYIKARTANQQFIPLFEKYLSEVWQGYINARNSSGPNTSDVNGIVEIATQIRELLKARRGGQPGGGLNAYQATNLSMEEFSSVVLATWFAFIISSDTGVVQFLNCQSSTIGERLVKIGAKVGVPAHAKCQDLFEMAGAAANILSLLEIGTYLESTGDVQTMLSSLDPGKTPTINSDYMNNFLTVINNWEKATGHKIKNPEANVRGTVSVRSNGVRATSATPVTAN